MRTVCLHEKQKIREFLQKNAHLHIYTLGDLDDFFWPYTTWYALMENQEIVQLVLVYCASSLPVLLAFSDDEKSAEMQLLLRSIVSFLPKRFYAHLQQPAIESLAQDYHLQSHGVHYKMALLRPDRIEDVDISRVNPLTGADLSDIEALYRVSYPENWFDARMLETGHYYGIWDGAHLVSIAGVHVYSREYDVAALGNITTHPAYRGQQLATRVSAGLCAALLRTVKIIGLNVHAENNAAISCYSRLGFERIGVYEEFTCTLK